MLTIQRYFSRSAKDYLKKLIGNYNFRSEMYRDNLKSDLKIVGEVVVVSGGGATIDIWLTTTDLPI